MTGRNNREWQSFVFTCRSFLRQITSDLTLLTETLADKETCDSCLNRYILELVRQVASVKIKDPLTFVSGNHKCAAGEDAGPDWRVISAPISNLISAPISNHSISAPISNRISAPPNNDNSARLSNHSISALPNDRSNTAAPINHDTSAHPKNNVNSVPRTNLIVVSTLPSSSPQPSPSPHVPSTDATTSPLIPSSRASDHSDPLDKFFQDEEVFPNISLEEGKFK